MPRAQYRTKHTVPVAYRRIGDARRNPRPLITPDLRQEPGAGKPHAGICAGGREQSLSLPRPSESSLFKGLRAAWGEKNFSGPGYVFDALGYRRYEWRCDDLNVASKRAAARFGFTFEPPA